MFSRSKLEIRYSWPPISFVFPAAPINSIYSADGLSSGMVIALFVEQFVSGKIR